MKWTPGGRSSNLEDRRSGGGMGAGLGIGGTVVVLALSLIFGRNLFSDLGVQPAVGTGGGQMTAADSAREEPEVQFVSFVLDDVQNTWAKVLPQYKAQFHPAHLVLFRNSTESGCGAAQSAMGPFYCPQDEKVYIDLGFYDELKQRFGAACDFAQAYVLAHEIGHHIQKVVGTEARVRQMNQGNRRTDNALSVKVELQADCYAGVWAHSTQQRNLLEQGDIQSALGAAAAVGDDRLQKMSTGHVAPDSFTHGSSAQRTHWFQQGFDSGSIAACNTFAAQE